MSDMAYACPGEMVPERVLAIVTHLGQRLLVKAGTFEMAPTLPFLASDPEDPCMPAFCTWIDKMSGARIAALVESIARFEFAPPEQLQQERTAAVDQLADSVAAYKPPAPPTEETTGVVP